MTTNGGGDTSLRSLRDRPFELLKELEKRSRTVTHRERSRSERGSRVGRRGVPHGWGDVS